MSFLSFCQYGTDASGNCLDENYAKITTSAPVSYGSEFYRANASIKEGFREDLSGNKNKDDKVNENAILFTGLFVAGLGALAIVVASLRK